MATYTLTARPSGSSQNNEASRIISSHFAYDPAQHKTISKITRRDGIWCSCGGTSQKVVLSGYDRLIDTSTGEVVKKSTTGSCTCHGTGPASENYMTCSFVNWTEDESNLAITLWAEGKLRITRTVWIKSYTSSEHGSPTFRDGYYNDDITITGSTIPFTEYAPAIDVFQVLRSADGITPDDMSATVWARIKLSMADASGLSDNPVLTLYHSVYQSMSGADAQEMSAVSIADCIASEQLIRLGNEYSIGSNQYFILVFSAGNESSPQAAASVGMAYVPLHINGNNHGVAVGGYSNATALDERFESMWQAFFHAGIKGVTNFELGEIPTGGTWIDGKPIYRQVLYRAANVNAGATVSIGSVNCTVGTLISLSGVFKQDGGRWYPLPAFLMSSNALMAFVNLKDDGTVEFKNNQGSQKHRDIVVIVEYTKV